MIDSYHHVEINGVKYRLAESAEGQHYTQSAEPLRPPNAVTVQGENSQKFQVRPDVLLWSLTDWSGGEGQIKYDSQAPNRHRILQGVRVFERPGTLKPGLYMTDTVDSGASDLTVQGFLVVADGVLYMYEFGLTQNTFYTWNAGTEQWDTGTSITGPTNGAQAVTTDGEKIFWTEQSDDSIWSSDPGSGTATELSSGVGPPGSTSLAYAGDYLYVIYESLQTIYEGPKSGASNISAFDTFDIQPLDSKLVSYNGKCYAMASNNRVTEIRELIPTSAAGAGYGRVIATLPGFSATDMWAVNGLLYLAGSSEPSSVEDSPKSILYIALNNLSYGTIGRIRPENNTGRIVASTNSGDQNVRLLDHFATTGQLAIGELGGLIQLDSVSGGYAALSVIEDSNITGSAARPLSLATFLDDIFIVARDNPTYRVLRAEVDRFTKSSYSISPWHDFDLADDKILSSLVLSMEDLPADWQVRVDYAVDGNDTWTNVIDNTTTNSNGETAQVSTDSSTVTFNTLSIRIRMDYTGGGVPTSAPVILGVDVRAQVLQKTKKWRLLLDCADDHKKGSQRGGNQKITNIRSAGDGSAVVAFKDGYPSRKADVFTEYDVIVDRYDIGLKRPQEGEAYVELLEVV